MNRKIKVSIRFFLTIVAATTVMSATAFATESETADLESSTVQTEEPQTEEGDGDFAYIDVMNATKSAERPCQVYVHADVPGGSPNLFITIMNTETGEMYKAPLTSTNEYIERFYVPIGTYSVVELQFYEDNTMQYPFNIPEDFSLTSETDNMELELTLVNPDILKNEIAEKIANKEKQNHICPICGEKLNDDGYCENPDCSNYTAPEEETVMPAQSELVDSDYEVTYSGTNPSVGLGITGENSKESDIIVKITKSGIRGTAAFKYSTDNGKQFSEDIQMPLSGIYPLDDDVKFTFVGDSFTQDETFTAFLPDPNKEVILDKDTKMSSFATVRTEDKHIYAYDIMVANQYDIIVKIVKGSKDGTDPVYNVSLDNGKTWLGEKIMSDNTAVVGNTGIYVDFNQTKYYDDETVHFTVPIEKKANYTSIFTALAFLGTAAFVFCKKLISMRTPNNAYNMQPYSPYKMENMKKKK